MRRRASVVVRTSFILLFLLAACGTQPERERDLPETQLPAPVATLRVALFPYLPDSGRDQFASFTRFVEGAFRTKYPTINLVLRPMDPNDDFYDWDTLKAWLTSPAEKPGYDLIEVDTVLLGDLVTAGLVAPWERVPGTADWHPVSARAVRINDAVYGIPHLLCGHFLITRNPAAIAARNIDELSAALRAIPNDLPSIVGDLRGSWNMPSLFLDAWADSRPGSSAAIALHGSLDGATLQDLKQFSLLCRRQGKNPCLDGTYRDPVLAAQVFARGEANAFFGYSERLFDVMSIATDPSAIQLTPAQMGRGKHPLLFTDALVLRRGAPDDVVTAARLFAAFLNSPEIQEVLAMSGDVSGNATPRYFLPATLSAFETPRLKKDRLYQHLRRAISNADPFPNTGFLNSREAVRDRIKAYLEQP